MAKRKPLRINFNLPPRQGSEADKAVDVLAFINFYF
jgi:hypothetical protein